MTRDQIDFCWLVVFVVFITHTAAYFIGYFAATSEVIEVITK